MTPKEICRCIKSKPHPAELHEKKIGPRGPTDADIMFVGMAPGRDEAIEEEFFVGAAGRRLQKDCVLAGVQFKNARIQNVAQYWPRNHDLSNLTEEQREEGREALLEDIRRVQPEVLVPLGNDALEALLGRRRITNWRGSTLGLTDEHPSLPPATVVPTVHPSAVLRSWDYRTLFINDLKRAAAVARGEDLSAPERRLVTAEDDEYREACEYFFQESREGTLLACDIEVFRGEVSCVSFADSPTNALSVRGDDRQVWRSILESDCPKLWHNAMYDTTFLKAKEGIDVGGEQHDTMLAWHALYPSLACSNSVGRSLAVLVSLFTKENYYKDTLKSWKDEADWEALYEYNAKDSAVTYEVFEAIRPKLEAEEVVDVYNFERSLLAPYRRAGIRGVRIDTRAKGAKAASTKKKINKVEERLCELADDPNFNPRSWQQVQAALKEMGVETKSTDKDHLTRIKLKNDPETDPHEFAKAMLEHRKLQKAYGTYYNFDYDDDGRVRTSWVIPGTETGRMANRKSIIFEGGANLMTIPRPARQFFIPDDGYKLVYADLAQAEARIVAYLAGSEPLIEAFESDRDPYKMVGAWMWEKDYENITKDERYLAKRCVLGLLYGMGPYKWRREMNIDKGFKYITQKRANKLYEQFFNTFPAIRRYHRWVEREVKRTRRIYTFGPVQRRRILRPRDGGFSDHQFREAYDYPPQGTVPDIINTGVLELEQYDPEIQLLGQIHDAWFGQVSERGGEMGERLQLVQDALTMPITVTDVSGTDQTFTIPVDLAVGDNWREYDEEENPDGLYEGSIEEILERED